jgi:hypothetical protein
MYIYNPNKHSVVISDLNIRIQPKQTIKVFSKNSLITQEMFDLSLASGSLFKLKKKIRILAKPPKPEVFNIKISSLPIINQDGFPSKIGKRLNSFRPEDFNLAETDEEYIKKMLEEEDLLWNPVKAKSNK